LNRPAVVAAFFVLISAASASGQHPDYSGIWTLEEPSASARPSVASVGDAAFRSGDMGSGWGSNITVTQDTTRLTVEYMFFARGDFQPPLKFEYAFDGSETRNSVMMGRGIQIQVSRAKWDGDKLVITTVHSFSHPETGQPMTSELKHTLSLESPARLIVESTRNGVLGGPPSTVRTIYRK